MSTVFLSYRHVQPDQRLAESLERALTEDGHTVFRDVNMTVGTSWVDEIERQLANAEFFVVLLSRDSIRSAMLRREAAMAHALAQGGRLRILPVRVAWEGALPYDLGAYLDPLQYAVWTERTESQAVAGQLLTAMRGSGPLPCTGGATASALKTLAESTDESRGAPLPSADIRLVQETDALRPRSRFYVRRKVDAALDGVTEMTGSTFVVKAPHQFGKTSLLARTFAAALKTDGLRACYLDFKLFDSAVLADFDSLADHLIGRIQDELRLPADASPALRRLGPKERLTHFLLGALSFIGTEQMMVVLDDADRLFDYPYREEFFAMVRGWHDARAFDDRLERFTFIISHSTNPALWIRDIRLSPFNVGTRLRIGGFARDEVRTLNKSHGEPLGGDAEITRLGQLLGGHPYLTRQALFFLASGAQTFDQLEASATENQGPFGDHLRDLFWAILRSDGLATALQSILRRSKCDSEEHFQRLEAAGIVTGPDRQDVAFANELYSSYFKLHL